MCVRSSRKDPCIRSPCESEIAEGGGFNRDGNRRRVKYLLVIVVWCWEIRCYRFILFRLNVIRRDVNLHPRDIPVIVVQFLIPPCKIHFQFSQFVLRGCNDNSFILCSKNYVINNDPLCWYNSIEIYSFANVLMERENYRRKGKRGEKGKNNVVIIRI